jgi:hypothetical protein
MNIQIFLNLDTLKATCEDPLVTVNEVRTVDGHLIIEVSKPDPEVGIIQLVMETQ